jgi:crotonobetainyl-CoA:carnitine CoA-transferase CaiB-like acyl-CoA transferase
LVEALNEVFAAQDAEEWLAVFREAGLPCAPINTIPDVFALPQAEARDLILAVEHPAAGTLRFPGFPYKLSETPAAVRLPPPRLGEHTDEVLTEVLGYSPEEVVGLRRCGVV